MAYDALRTLLDCMEALQPALTKPGYQNALIIMVGWILTHGTHAVTVALVATHVAGARHHEAFHRFFSRGSWNPDELGRRLFEKVLVHLGTHGPVRAVIDDTLAEKRGEKVFGIASHIDPVRSTKKRKVFSFGHVWVVLTVVVRVPFSKRPWSVPVMFRLYRSKQECEAKGDEYRKKTELAREMLDIFVTWTCDRTIRLAADEAYSNRTVLKDLPQKVTFFGSMRADAVLTAPPPKRKRTSKSKSGSKSKGKGGRPPVCGKKLPKPAAIARRAQGWESMGLELYGQLCTVVYQSLTAQWYRVCGGSLLRIVVVRVDHGQRKLRVFFCTKDDILVEDLLLGYAERWSIEVCFRNLKQLLGFADSSARKKEAVERTAPFVGFIYTILVIWFLEGIYRTPLATPPVRPWYTHKVGFSFADVLRAAQRALLPFEVLDSARSLDNLRKLSGGSKPTPDHELKRAA